MILLVAAQGRPCFPSQHTVDVARIVAQRLEIGLERDAFAGAEGAQIRRPRRKDLSAAPEAICQIAYCERVAIGVVVGQHRLEIWKYQKRWAAPARGQIDSGAAGAGGQRFSVRTAHPER